MRAAKCRSRVIRTHLGHLEQLPPLESNYDTWKRYAIWLSTPLMTCECQVAGNAYASLPLTGRCQHMNKNKLSLRDHIVAHRDL